MLRFPAKNLAFGFSLLAVLLITGAAWLLFQQKKIDSAIEQGIRYYAPEQVAQLRIDDALLYRLIARSGAVALPDPAPDFSRWYEGDPARRLLDRDAPLPGLAITRKVSRAARPATVDNSFYTLSPPYDRALRDPYDDILFKIIACDETGYDEEDFAILRSIGSGRGDSADTHLLFGLLLLKESGCFTGTVLDSEIETVTERIAVAAAQDDTFGDLYAERIVFLYWAGYGDRVHPGWIWRIADRLAVDGWRDGDDPTANAHTTGLALLSLIYFEAGKDWQSMYPVDEEAL
jgi:hypothetical protein